VSSENTIPAPTVAPIVVATRATRAVRTNPGAGARQPHSGWKLLARCISFNSRYQCLNHLEISFPSIVKDMVCFESSQDAISVCSPLPLPSKIDWRMLDCEPNCAVSVVELNEMLRSGVRIVKIFGLPSGRVSGSIKKIVPADY
jgi:hypothetical protein